MRALITGITGFAGSHLAEHCLAQSDVQVIGLVRHRTSLGHVSHLGDRLEIVEANLRDGAATATAVAAAAPDVVFHLAGQAAVPRAFDDPVGTLLDNVVGQLHVIQALLRHCPQARLLVVGSGAEYGLVRPEENPVDEGAALRPADPYAVSKVTQDLLGYQYFVSHRLQSVRVRPFNHTGPRQSDLFVASHFARRIAEIEAGASGAELSVGNLTAVRDFTDVRDIARAYFLAATLGEAGEVYNLGSGRGCSIAEVLELLIGHGRVRPVLRPDPSRLRPLDVPTLIADAGRFRARTRWEPEIPLDRTLADTLAYWRARVASN